MCRRPYKSGTRSFLEVSILINLGIVTFLISENRDTFEVSVHRATLVSSVPPSAVLLLHVRIVYIRLECTALHAHSANTCGDCLHQSAHVFRAAYTQCLFKRLMENKL